MQPPTAQFKNAGQLKVGTDVEGAAEGNGVGDVGAPDGTADGAEVGETVSTHDVETSV